MFRRSSTRKEALTTNESAAATMGAKRPVLTKEKSRKRKSDNGQDSPGSPSQKKRRISSPNANVRRSPRRSPRLQRKALCLTNGPALPNSPAQLRSKCPATSTPKLPTLKSQAPPLPTATSTPAGPLCRNNSGASHSTDSTESISCSKMSAEGLPFDMHMGTEVSCRWERTGRPPVSSHAFSITGCQKERNQDWCSISVQNEYTNVEPHVVFTVCDGHGILGHMSSRHCARTIPDRISKALARGSNVRGAIGVALEKAHEELVEYSRYNTTMMQLIFRRACGETSRQLDYGTTAVVGHIAGDELTVANIGDSRAILLTAEQGRGQARLRIQQLTVDHNPTQRKDEVARIKAAGGRVTNTGQELRISPSHLTFLESRRNGLTINMSRAVGHDLLQHAGVAAIPEYATVKLDRTRTQFLVAGSDGIFDVLSNEEVRRTVLSVWRLHTGGKFNGKPREGLERAIVLALTDRANEAWRGSRGDNVTAMVIHFPSGESDPSSE